MKQHSGAWCHKTVILLGFIILTGGICKIAVFFTVQAIDSTRIFSPDSITYVSTAQALLKTGHFSVSPEKSDVPQVERTPGYPFFIASIFFLFGEKYSPMIITQILASLCTILFTYLIVATLWESNIGIIAAALLSLDFPSFVNSQKVLTDTLFTFMLSAAIFAGIQAMKRHSLVVSWTLLHGILLSLATLIRPITYYAIFLVVTTFTIILRNRVGWQWKRVGQIIIIIIVPWTTLVGGWQLRNYVVVGYPEFSCVVGWNLLFCRGAGIIAQRDRITFEEARQHLAYGRYTEVHPETAGWSRAKLNQRWKREGLDIILQHPLLFMESVIRGALRMMFGTGWKELLMYIAGTDWTRRISGGPIGDISKLPITEYLHKWIVKKSWWFLLFVFAESYLILFYVCCLLSIWQIMRSWKKSPFEAWEKEAHVLIWMFVLYLFVVSISAGPEAYFRFRIPIMPLLSVYAGHGVYQIVLLLKQRMLQAR